MYLKVLFLFFIIISCKERGLKEITTDEIKRDMSKQLKYNNDNSEIIIYWYKKIDNDYIYLYGIPTFCKRCIFSNLFPGPLSSASANNSLLNTKRLVNNHSSLPLNRKVTNLVTDNKQVGMFFSKQDIKFQENKIYNGDCLQSGDESLVFVRIFYTSNSTLFDLKIFTLSNKDSASEIIVRDMSFTKSPLIHKLYKVDLLKGNKPIDIKSYYKELNEMYEFNDNIYKVIEQKTLLSKCYEISIK